MNSYLVSIEIENTRTARTFISKLVIEAATPLEAVQASFTKTFGSDYLTKGLWIDSFGNEMDLCEEFSSMEYHEHSTIYRPYMVDEINSEEKWLLEQYLAA